jgi:hypothetical protein
VIGGQTNTWPNSTVREVWHASIDGIRDEPLLSVEQSLAAMAQQSLTPSSLLPSQVGQSLEGLTQLRITATQKGIQPSFTSRTFITTTHDDNNVNGSSNGVIWYGGPLLPTPLCRSGSCVI